jgi:ATP-dependent Lhr-like helicase
VAAAASAIELLQGVALPASGLEKLVLPARVGDYTPAYLDELCASGEVVWCGSGAIGAADGWIHLAYADSAALLLPLPNPELAGGPVHEAILDTLNGGQALFFRQLSDRLEEVDDADVAAAVWDLVWAGYLSNDTIAPLRALLAGGTGAHKAQAAPGRSRYRRLGRPVTSTPGGFHRAATSPSMAGRWYQLPDRDTDPTRRAAATVDALLERHGVITRGAVMAEDVPGGFAGVYPVLGALEERGVARRGYFVEGLGAAQFAVPGAVDRLRTLADRPPRAGAVVLASTDPANPFGAALPWPDRPVDDGSAPGSPSGHRAGRKAGALVVLVDGALTIYVERGGRTLLSYAEDPDTLTLSAKALADAVHAGALGSLSVERADGASVHASPLRDALTAAGFRVTPRGLRLRG